jgi:hypothetical protein
VITEPGVYDLPVDDYHADPVEGGSLSSTGARKLLPPSAPAKFKWWRDHGDPPTRAFDLGHAAHHKVLGTGPDVMVIDADTYNTKAARAERDAAHAAGQVPLLAHEADVVEDMADALRKHPKAGPLFDPSRGRAEQTLVARDPETGVWCRALFDTLHNGPSGAGGVFLIPDYKTSKSAAPDDLSRALQNYLYHQQLEWYAFLARLLGVAGDAPIAAVLVVQEKTPPYLVVVAQVDVVALTIARDRNRKARHLYQWCTERDEWPGYSDTVINLALPRWAEYQHHDAVDRGDYRLATDSTQETS